MLWNTPRRNSDTVLSDRYTGESHDGVCFDAFTFSEAVPADKLAASGSEIAVE